MLTVRFALIESCILFFFSSDIKSFKVLKRNVNIYKVRVLKYSSCYVSSLVPTTYKYNLRRKCVIESVQRAE